MGVYLVRIKSQINDDGRCKCGDVNRGGRVGDVRKYGRGDW